MAALALDPAVQGIVYCGIFMLMPLGNALLPLLLKEYVYLIWVVKEVLQIMAPGQNRLGEDRERWAGTGGCGGGREERGDSATLPIVLQDILLAILR